MKASKSLVNLNIKAWIIRVAIGNMHLCRSKGSPSSEHKHNSNWTNPSNISSLYALGSLSNQLACNSE